MNRFVTSFGLLAALLACSADKAPTPDHVTTEFHTLLDSLDTDTPGTSIRRLESFLVVNESYAIADSARQELKRLEAAMQGRYHEARELARDGEFDRAERALVDLAQAPDTEDGASAVKHLEFEFYFEKAKWLLIRQRPEESERIARDLLTRDLNRFQRDQVEQILDHTSHVGAAVAMTEHARAEGAVRQLIVFLANVYVNDGRYPATFSLSDLENLDPYTSKSIQSSLASIEEYRATQDNYTLVAVDKRGKRIRIVDGEIKN